MAEEIENAIRQNAEGPESAEEDGVRMKQHPLPDQIEADKYLATKEAASRNPAKAFTRVKIVPPGAVEAPAVSGVEPRDKKNGTSFDRLRMNWPWIRRKKVQAAGQLMFVRARFYAAQTTPDNRKHWSNADHLSSNANRTS